MLILLQSVVTSSLDRNLDSVIENLAKNFAEGTEYFKVSREIVVRN